MHISHCIGFEANFGFWLNQNAMSYCIILCYALWDSQLYLLINPQLLILCLCSCSFYNNYTPYTHVTNMSPCFTRSLGVICLHKQDDNKQIHINCHFHMWIIYNADDFMANKNFKICEFLEHWYVYDDDQLKFPKLWIFELPLIPGHKFTNRSVSSWISIASLWVEENFELGSTLDWAVKVIENESKETLKDFENFRCNSGHPQALSVFIWMWVHIH